MPKNKNERLPPGSMHLRHDTRFETYCGLPLAIDGSMNFTNTMTRESLMRVTCKKCKTAHWRDIDFNKRSEDILEKLGSQKNG